MVAPQGRRGSSWGARSSSSTCRPWPTGFASCRTATKPGMWGPCGHRAGSAFQIPGRCPESPTTVCPRGCRAVERSHRGNSWAMGGALGRSFGSGWPTAVWSCTQASRRDRHVRDNRPVRTGWCRWRGPDPLERAAAKPAREAKPEDVLVPWLTWGVWNASGCAPISTRSMRSGGQLMTPNSAACELDHAPAAVLQLPCSVGSPVEGCRL